MMVKLRHADLRTRNLSIKSGAEGHIRTMIWRRRKVIAERGNVVQ
jgi:hypothetical protein